LPLGFGREGSGVQAHERLEDGQAHIRKRQDGRTGDDRNA
jgi:hypothetical protein